MSHWRIQDLIQQRRAITPGYMAGLAALAGAILAGGVALLIWGGGWVRGMGILILLAGIGLGFQTFLLLYTCVDRSELRIRGLRQKLSHAARSSPELPEPVREAMLRVAGDRRRVLTYAAAQRDVELNNMVVRIVDGNFQSLEQINEALGPFGLSLRGGAYVLTLFHTLEIPDDAFDLNVEQSLRVFGYPNPLAAFFRTIIGEMYGTACDCLICEGSGIFRCIVTARDHAGLQDLSREVLELSNRIVEIFRRCLSITMLGAVSQARTDFGGIRASSEELARLTECRAFVGDTRSVLTYEDLDMTEQTRSRYRQGVQRQQELIQLVNARQFDSARALCGEILDQSGESAEGGVLFSRFLLRDLAYACLFSVPLPPEQVRQLYERLNNTRSVQEFHGFFEALISCAQEAASDREAGAWTEQMARYIEAHYMEQELTVSTVSALFHYNPIYATRIFKQQTGRNISEYIQEQRLLHSRELLGTGKTVREIAGACGFSSVAAMNRVYAKVYGVSPGKLNGKTI